MSLTALVPGRTLAEYEELRDLIGLGHARARRAFLSAPAKPTPEEFPAFVRTVHGVIFGQAFPDGGFAGRFRTKDEPVYVGGDGRNSFEGLPGTKIELALVELCRRTRALHGVPTERPAFAAWAAVFLEQFFRIHPFRDGNGRTARLLVEIAAGHTPHLGIADWGTTSKERRRYVQALEFAHRNVASADERSRLNVNPFGPLARWIAKYVIDQREFDDPWADEDLRERSDDADLFIDVNEERLRSRK